MRLAAVFGIVLSCLLALLQTVKQEGYISPENPVNQRHIQVMKLRDQAIEQGDPFTNVRVYLANGMYPAAWYKFRIYAGYFHNPLSAYMLANLYKNGNGVPANTQLAEFWAKQAMLWAKEYNDPKIHAASIQFVKTLERKP